MNETDNNTTISHLLLHVRDCHAIMNLSEKLGVAHPIAMLGAIKLAEALNRMMAQSTPDDFLEDEYKFIETCFNDLQTLHNQIQERLEKN